MRSVLKIVASVGFAIATAGLCQAEDSHIVKHISTERVGKWLEELQGKVGKMESQELIWEMDSRKVRVFIHEKLNCIELNAYYRWPNVTAEQCNQWNARVRFVSLAVIGEGQLVVKGEVFVADGLTVKGVKQSVRRFVEVMGFVEAFIENGGKMQDDGGHKTPGGTPPVVNANDVRDQIARLKDVAQDAEANAKLASRFAAENRDNYSRAIRDQLPGALTYQAEAARYAREAAFEEATARDARRKIVELEALLARIKK